MSILALSNPNVHNLQNILAYLIEREPSSIYLLDGRVNRTPLHIACSNKGVTLKVFQLVYNAWPEAFTLGSGFFGFHPIHELCFNKNWMRFFHLSFYNACLILILLVRWKGMLRGAFRFILQLNTTHQPKYVNYSSECVQSH